MKRLRYNVAMSLDGFIAGPNGEYDWIPEDPGVDFAALFAEFETFVMGRKTFEMVQALGAADPTRGRRILVASTTLSDPGIPGVEVVGADVADRIRMEKGRAGKDLWLFGGATLFRHLLDAGVVDRVEISVIPVLLGGGIRLVPEGRRHALKLVSSEALPNGILQLVYSAQTYA